MFDKNKEDFQLEEDHLLTTILDLRYFDPWRNNANEFSLQNDSGLEIFITNVCNQNCEYCYLVKHEELYPKDKRDPELLLHNLRVLYDYIIQENFFIPKIEFFTGEIWHTQFGLDVMDITLEYMQKGMRIGWCMAASNCSFVLYPEQMHKIQNRIDIFKRMGSAFVFSISVDGYYLEEITRPLNSKVTRTEEFYDNLFAFARHNNFGFHPMLSAASIEYWDKNYDWWMKKLHEYDFDLSAIMMLEVRNNDWTDEKIDCYIKFLKKLIDQYLYVICKGDIKVFCNSWYNISGGKQCREELAGYATWVPTDVDTFIGCSAGIDLCVRLGDFAIAPCHRTAYNKYLYGKFIVEDDKIVGIKANNPYMAAHVLMANHSQGIFKCDTCVFRNRCLKGCLGSQLEQSGDPFIPIPCVCKLFEAKNNFIFAYFKQLGVWDYFATFTEPHPDYDRI